ncbi:MAG: D-tyrosyl-tRNA(Tyr) deacylase [Firmicutes bacterium]|nr:D-tyrosyl-tRNA(Tyr) deacylase [Bacillota bacterium]
MRIVFQRVSRAAVAVDGEEVASIGPGALVLVGVGVDDTADDALYLAEKTANLRVFADGEQKMNHSLLDIRGEALVVSQFTLYGDCRKGRRPSWHLSAPPGLGKELYELYCRELSAMGVPIATGVFGAMMDVSLVNDGPVTMLIDSKREF